MKYMLMNKCQEKTKKANFFEKCVDKVVIKVYIVCNLTD